MQHTDTFFQVPNCAGCPEVEALTPLADGLSRQFILNGGRAVLPRYGMKIGRKSLFKKAYVQVKEQLCNGCRQ